ncbi:MAG: type II toxin-antitoxin system VapC family toxin [Nocardioidaceae bacterium]
MKIPDVNVLVNALNPDAEQHEISRRWLERALSGQATVGFSWLVLIGVLRLTTMRQVFDRPFTAEEAIGWVRSWLEQPTAGVVQPTARHADILAGLLDAAGRAGNLVNDAHLAALAVEHRAEVVTFDSDFARFPGVRWERPTIEEPS